MKLNCIATFLSSECLTYRRTRSNVEPVLHECPRLPVGKKSNQVQEFSMNMFRDRTRSLLLVALLSLLVIVPARVITAQDVTHAEIKISQRVFDAYIGQYQDAADPAFVFSFFREGDKYYVQATDQSRIEIFPETETRFFVKLFDAQVDFVRAGGKVTSIVWHQGGKAYPAQKVSDQPAADTRVPFARTETMIPMRDGARLHTIILTPQNQTDPLPIIIQRTPYGIDNDDSDGLNGRERDLVAD